MIDRLPGDIFRQGQVLNHTYEIEGVLGRGGTGEVYRARNQISGRIVAIKALNSQFSGNDDYIELMKREEQMRDVLNDAVVRYTECSRTDQGHVFLVMDFIDGPSMSEVMMRRRMDPRELMIIAHRVAEGLVAAHARGIVHRDLSPDNIVLRDSAPERAVIIDFGIAKDTSAGARTVVGNEFAGKYEYAAPEQLEGRAEKRSDLYALGATLLAAYRGQVPFSGSTPGEIIRRKQSKLDTEGVPEPLKGLVDWLAAPALADRPTSAEAVVARLDQALQPVSARGKRQAPQPATTPAKGKGRGGTFALLFALLLGLGGVGAWTAGLFDSVTEPGLPVAAPYRLTASLGPQGTALSGNAPDAEAAIRLRQAFAAATGTTPAEDALPLALGVPDDRWVGNILGALAAVTGLAEWSLSVTDNTVAITGLADNRTQADDRRKAIADWSASSGLTPSVDIAVGPRVLTVKAVQDILAPFALCGRLNPDKGPDDSYALGDTVRITGALETTETRDTLQKALEDTVGDRTVRVDATILNAQLCAVQRVLPPVPSEPLSIWLGDGATGQVNLSGIYHVGENPIVEVLVPADLTGLSLWVVVVDNGGSVFNLLPNIQQSDHDIQDIGIIDNGQRRIRVLHTAADVQARKALFGTVVDDKNFGKSEVIAVLSKTSLFGIRRPKDESIASFAEALEEIVREDPGNIVSVATRVIDARP
ncbi:serine/threonine-protein kinase [Tabrizicola sp.]|uniref:serine/threonine-protein kinase n=1 Tax=Tabrizicola sp. TaxID=2005166 RepID=UPI003F2AE04A